MNKYYVELYGNYVINMIKNPKWKSIPEGWVLYKEIEEPRDGEKNIEIDLSTIDENGCFIYKKENSEIIETTQEEREIQLFNKNKKKLINKIDNLTSQGMVAGYEYGGKKISTSKNARLNWAALKDLLDMGNGIEWPHKLSFTDGDCIDVNTEEELKEIYKDAVKSKMKIYRDILVIRKKVFDATTQAELDAIEGGLDG
ncbi:MAG: hypothetical protein R3250_04240 [Melioribacteraceae bacterium]|nr:hypothetical protein [Melioribacteraceae bacterium]